MTSTTKTKMDIFFKPFKIVAVLSKYFILGLLIFGFLFGMSLIVGILIYILIGSDLVLKFMADVLTRIIEIKNYFNLGG